MLTLSSSVNTSFIIFSIPTGLYSGNVSAKKAKDFFVQASKLLHEARSGAEAPTTCTEINDSWIPGTIRLRHHSIFCPWYSFNSSSYIASRLTILLQCLSGPLENRLLPGDTELHFPSNNPTEENGAVLVTFQSSIPGFRGEGLSPPESLQSTAAIRLLSHMLREPLFDELRTKQQLGYIVHSYYDLSFSTPRPSEADFLPGTTTPVDFLVVGILSRKVSPPEVAERIDSFLDDFRQTLMDMPESSIADHASALKAKLLKPIQKLSAETNNHFGKIRRFGPEILSKGGNDKDLPWDNAKVLANAIGNLKRADLVEAWDRLVQPRTRSRVISHIYGSTHPLATSNIRASSGKVVSDSIPDLIKLRGQLERFDGRLTGTGSRQLLKSFGSNKVLTGVAAIATVIGVGYIGLSMIGRSRKSAK